ncbi:MAG: SCO family protein, partial [Martelella sp.]
MIKLPVLAMLLALLAVPAFAAHDANFDPFGLAGIDERPDAEIPLDLLFRNADGETVTLAELADGKP